MGERGEPFQGGTFEGGKESLAEDVIVKCVESDMDNVHLKVLVWVGIPYVVVQCEGFPLAREGCGGDDVNERVATSGLVWWYGMSDDGGECGGVVVRKDVSGKKGGSRVIGCRLCKDGG